MSFSADALRELLYSSGLSAHEFASALGVSARTLELHLAGRRSSRVRRAWYRKVKHVTVNADRTITFTVAYTAPTRKPWNWSRETRMEKSKRAQSKRRAAV